MVILGSHRVGAVGQVRAGRGLVYTIDLNDCNGNGIGDFCEIVNDGLLDANADGVPEICALPCDSIDFNGDTLFPDTADINDFLSVFSGGVCEGQPPSDPPCNTDIDFNNDGLFPDTMDIDALLSTFSGGPCIR